MRHKVKQGSQDYVHASQDTKESKTPVYASEDPTKESRLSMNHHKAHQRSENSIYVSQGPSKEPRLSEKDRQRSQDYQPMHYKVRQRSPGSVYAQTVSPPNIAINMFIHKDISPQDLQRSYSLPPTRWWLQWQQKKTCRGTNPGLTSADAVAADNKTPRACRQPRATRPNPSPHTLSSPSWQIQGSSTNDLEIFAEEDGAAMDLSGMLILKNTKII